MVRPSVEQYDVRWTGFHLPAGDEKVVQWLNEPRFQRFLLLGYFLYEILRIGLTTLVTLIVVLAASNLSAAMGGGGVGGVVLTELSTIGINVFPVVPDGFSPMTVGTYWLLFGAAFFVVLLELSLAIASDRHRVISSAAIHVVYYTGLLTERVLSRAGYRDSIDTEKFEDFKSELIADTVTSRELAYLLISQRFGKFYANEPGGT